MRKTIGWLQSQIDRHGWVRVSTTPAKLGGVPQVGAFDVVIQKRDGTRHTYHVYNPAAVK